MRAVCSPITGKDNCEHVGSIDKSTVIDLYASGYDIDVSSYFKNIEAVEKYQCLDTGLMFFKPDTLSGTGALYEKLQKFDWFYKESKWEYEKAIRFVNVGDRVLDVGCGHGHFLDICNNAGAAALGLEFNKKAYLHANSKGHSVHQESIEKHSSKLDELYDVVCTFQVLEHVVDIKNFVAACLVALKPGGFFVIGVPNNDSFLKFAKTNCLNMPPHHMSLWNRKSLESLPKFMDCKLHSIEIEPLKEISWYQAVMEEHYIPNKLIKSFFYRIGGSRIFNRYIRDNSNSIAGHTILAVYQKDL